MYLITQKEKDLVDQQKERELYVLKQDQEIQELMFDLLLTKLITVPIAIFNGFLYFWIVSLL